MREINLTEKDVMDQVKGTEDLADALLDTETPGSGIPFNQKEPDQDMGESGRGRKVNESELREKLKRGYI